MTDSDAMSMEEKLDRLLELQEQTSRNIYALYRRTTALAHMMEALSDGAEPRLPKTMRAEIDASLNPDYFEQLAKKDSAEFIRRYGEQVLDVLQMQGIAAITRIGEFAPLKSEGTTH